MTNGETVTAIATNLDRRESASLYDAAPAVHLTACHGAFRVLLFPLSIHFEPLKS